MPVFGSQFVKVGGSDYAFCCAVFTNEDNGFIIHIFHFPY
jgi:hypothetical protein